MKFYNFFMWRHTFRCQVYHHMVPLCRGRRSRKCSPPQPDDVNVDEGRVIVLWVVCIVRRQTENPYVIDENFRCKLRRILVDSDDPLRFRTFWYLQNRWGSCAWNGAPIAWSSLPSCEFELVHKAAPRLHLRLHVLSPPTNIRINYFTRYFNTCNKFIYCFNTT